MSRGERQERRRKEREAIKEAERVLTHMKKAERETLLEAADRFTSDMKSPVPALPPEIPVVQKRLRKLIADAGVAAPLTGLLRNHPGIPSPIMVEGLVLGGLMNVWASYSYWRKHVQQHLLRLPTATQDELGLKRKDGNGGWTLGLKYRTLHKQLERLEDTLLVQWEKGDPYDSDWMEHQMVSASVPKDFLGSVESVAIDETANPSWYRMHCALKQEDVDKEVAAIYRQRHPRTPVPPMSAQAMRDIAAELGVPIGPDGRIERNPFTPSLRSGYKTSTPKNPEGFFVGHGVTMAIATRAHTLSRNSDKVTKGPSMRAYIVAGTSNPANTNQGPVGLKLAQRVRSIAPNLKHVHADQGFTGKPSTFTVPLRREGIEPHMGLPSNTTSAVKVVKFKHRDGTYETVFEHCGVLYHKFTPRKLFGGSYERLKPWRWVVHDRYSDGSIRFRCPFCAGAVFNRQIACPSAPRESAQFVRVPKDATRCCGGTFVAQPEDIPRFQTPDYGSNAHKEMKGLRNPSEGGFGNVKDLGGFSNRSCRAKDDEAPALAAIYSMCVRNLQMTMHDEIMALRLLRKAKQTRKAEAAVRKSAQEPSDGSMRAEPESDDEDSETSEDDEPSSGVEAPSRAPP